MLNEKQEHESYGMIGISHTTCNHRFPLFGSSIKHDRLITLEIKHAEVERSLYSDRYYGQARPIIKINMSPAQFAQFITTPNVGDGVPCTIRSIGVAQMDDPPFQGKQQVYNEELQAEFKKAIDDADELLTGAQEILTQKRTMKVADKAELHGKIKALVQHIKDNMPFLHEQYTRAMEKTEVEAKAAIEEFYTSASLKLGKEALEAGHVPAQPMIEDGGDDGR